jgi:hypothetical protein
MLDLKTETPIPLAEAAALIPPARGGKKTHLSTLLRWIVKGVRSPIGETVRLEAIRLGGRWMTSREALQRFAERLTPPLISFTDGSLSSASPPLTLSRRERAAAQAGRELDRLGF